MTQMRDGAGNEYVKQVLDAMQAARAATAAAGELIKQAPSKEVGQSTIRIEGETGRVRWTTPGGYSVNLSIEDAINGARWIIDMLEPQP